MKATELKQLKAFLSTPRKVVITTHKGPDGDAMGSSLALYNYLLKKGHSVQVITPNDYPKFLKWMKGDKQVIEYCFHQEKATRITAKAELIFCLDFNILSRIDTYAPVVEAANAPKVLIDHHQQPDTFDFNFSDTSACSTAQLIFEFLEMLGDTDLIDQDIAECLYAGIMTDTGNFRFNSVSSKTHQIVAFLIEKGARNDWIYDQIHDNNSVSRLKLLGYCLSEKMEVLPELGAAIIHLTKEELERFNFKKGDTEGVVNYALSIEGVNMAAFMVEKDGIVKISFRSKGLISVNQLARDHFSGGGHINAAGGAHSNMSEAITTFKNVIPNYINNN
ncbi:bifunctional oligoribonuclease/PAP phosphatase NrnA [Flavobacteriales bacterium]|jgi:bifunctional oligoribonuclease and PAP phosphatase NrnA|nr:bifunctional oligoribonuclease/PAP phosphatase NrnA [Flavobacteriales bacterium]